MPSPTLIFTQNCVRLISLEPSADNTSHTSNPPGALRESLYPYKKPIFKSILCGLLLFIATLSSAADKIVIARNCAGEALIENSLPAIVLAASRKVQFLELQVNMSKDGKLILFKDLTLNRMTDAAEIFPEKMRGNGSFYILDFTLAELRQLRIKNVFENEPKQLSFTIPTLVEALHLIQRLEDIFDYSIGITVEPVDPQYYLENNHDISESIIDTLIRFGYPKNHENLVFLQTSDSDELQRIHTSILPTKQVILPLIQMVQEADEEITDPVNQKARQRFEQEWVFTNIGLRHLASYADAIALPDSRIFSQEGTVLHPKYMENIKKYGLKILITSTDLLQALPMYANNTPAMLNLFYNTIFADGIYTDDYLTAQNHNTSLAEQAKRKAELPEFFSNLNLTLPAPRQEDATIPIDPKKNPKE